MKRSEAVRQIREWLLQNHIDGPSIDANKLLRHLERMGMLPPAYDKIGFGLDYENKWEPEDEDAK